MSQAKVDRYKESKKNRKKEVQKNRRNQMIAKIVVPICVIAVVCWIGFSGYKSYQDQKPSTTTEVDMTALTDFMSSIAQ